MLRLVDSADGLPTNDRCFARQMRELLRMEYKDNIKAPDKYADALADQMATKRIQKAIRDGSKEIEEIDKHWKVF